MQTLKTSGIEVMVESFYQPEYSSEVTGEYFFSYHVTLHNHNSFTVQLLRRKWKITDSTFEVRFVEGNGVVGRQPVLYPDDSHQYVSGCNFKAPIGKMEGAYVFQNKTTGEEFEVRIPPFVMAIPSVLN